MSDSVSKRQFIMSHQSTYKKQAFKNILQLKKVIVLDGGLSNQLESQGFDLNNTLWSASWLRDNEAEIIKAHRLYLEAGADCIITASYQASEKGFIAQGIESDVALKLISKSVALAQQAVDEYLLSNKSDFRPLVAASIGPYGACQADGSEYHGEYGISDNELLAFHQTRLQLLDKTNADIIACETIPSFQEARVLHNLLLSVDTPAWVSFSCKNEYQINDGTLLEKVVQLFSEHPNVLAIGINCTAPEYITDLINVIKQYARDKVIVVYPNSGEKYDPVNKHWRGISSPESCGVAAISWVEAGARIVGGCCRMGPEHIREIHEAAGS